MKKILLIGIVIMYLTSFGQDSLTIEQPIPQPLTISGYVEGYYSYDFNRPESNTRPGFLYSHNRHNEFSVNLAFVKGSYSAERVRANLAIGVGTYMNANYSAEPGVLKNIYEGNVGYKLSAKHNLWLDIGVLPSHIGFESAVSKDCWALTRSLSAENSPYFESGAKLSYGTNNGIATFSILALNGWQRITRVEGNSLMSWGTQAFIKPNDKITLNYSTFLGTDKPDSARLVRFFNNFYGIFQFSEKIGFTAGLDFVTEEKTPTGDGRNNLFNTVGILRYTPVDRWAFAFRAEHYEDENGIIIATGTPDGFKTTGLSFNIDYLPISNAALRLEVRSLNSKDRIFSDKDGGTKKSNTAITFSTAISF